MPDTSTDAQQAALLAIFSKLKDGRISAGDLKKKFAAVSKKDPAPDASEVDAALVGLIEQAFISVSGGGKDGHHPRPNASYRLTDQGKRHVRPARPDISDEQLQGQEAFILLQVFRSKEKKLTRSELNAKLKTRAAVGQLEFDVKEVPETVDYHLAELVEKYHLDEERRGNSVSYALNPENGTGALASATQHAGVSFTLTGETLNALIAAARASKPGQASDEDTVVSEEPDAAAPAPSRSLVAEDIDRYIEQLRQDKYAGKDLIPIHEVRRLVAEHHGAEAAGHPTFDPLIKRMRSEDELELIAISDNRDATQQQLDDSIPGMNETIFFVVVK